MRAAYLPSKNPLVSVWLIRIRRIDFLKQSSILFTLDILFERKRKQLAPREFLLASDFIGSVEQRLFNRNRYRHFVAESIIQSRASVNSARSM